MLFNVFINDNLKELFFVHIGRYNSLVINQYILIKYLITECKHDKECLWFSLVVTKTRNHPKPPKTTQNHPKPPTKPPKTTYKTNQNDPKPATIYPNTTSLRDICVDGRP